MREINMSRYCESVDKFTDQIDYIQCPECACKIHPTTVSVIDTINGAYGDTIKVGRTLNIQFCPICGECLRDIQKEFI